MKSYSHKYINNDELNTFIELHRFADAKSCLVQVFSGKIDSDFLKTLMSTLCEQLPNAHIIGSTTDGEIQNQKVSLDESIISISTFKDVRLRSGCVEGRDSYSNAKELYEDIADDKTRLMIVFSDGIYSNGDEVLAAFRDLNEDMIVAGGMAAENSKFIMTYVMHQTKVIEQGLVGVSFESDSLQVNTHYSFDWVPIGKEMLITKAEGNRVYEVDGISTYSVFEKYLGDNVAQGLPYIGIEFPFIMQENGINIARATIRTHNDGSFSFAGNLPTGTKVRFGVGSPELILRHGQENAHSVNRYPVEAVFIYSCMARRRFLQEKINAELELFPSEIPVSGFFTYGEFFSSKKHKQLLNQSMTMLMLSETTEVMNTQVNKSLQKNLQGEREFSESLEALAHLVNVTSSELNQLNQSLEQRVEDKVKELEKSTRFFQQIFETANDGIWVVDLDKDTIMVNNSLCEILGLSENELIGTSIYNYMDEVGKKKFYRAATLAETIGRSSKYELELIHKNKQRTYCLFSTEVLRDENEEIIGSFAMVSDITKRKRAEEELVSFNVLLEERIAEEVLKNHSKDELMTKQMRLAQMGEMISMIAHQWRQPLSTISAIIGSMQLELSLKEEEESSLFIDMDKLNDHVQFLSTTIDDFRHFFNPNKNKENIHLSNLLNNALGIMKQSLIQKRIDIVSDFENLQRPLTLYSGELIQVFLNLMKNSMDVLCEKEQTNAYISIRGSEYEDKSVVVFEDNGGGIPDKILVRVFEPYFTTKDEKNGTGLGLYMSKMIIEEHCNGQIIVENTEVGARFTIALPH